MKQQAVARWEAVAWSINSRYLLPMRAAAAIISLFLISFTSAPAQFLSPKSATVPSSCSSKSTFGGAFGIRSPTAFADPSIDVTYYRLNLRLWTSASLLSGSVLMKARCLADSLRTVGLDLMNVMHVDSVLAGGVPVGFLQYPAVLILNLDRTYSRHETLAVEVFYHGTPVGTGFGSFEFSSHASTSWAWSLSEPYGARDWWPCKDHPADKADSVDVWVTTDAQFKVGSNGRLVSVTDNGDGTKTTKWAERYPIATYLVSVAATNYAEFTNWWHYSPSDSMQVLNYVLPEDLDSAQVHLPHVLTMLDIFSHAYGQYPFVGEKYGHSQFGFGGAMEHQTMTSTTSFDETVVAHELSHQWFGDLITCANWQSLWLNEGFASYSEAVYHEAVEGAPGYWRIMGDRMTRALQAPGSLFVEDTSVVRTLFDDHRVYSKGASVLHMLRHVLGDSVFFASLRTYVANPALRYGSAVTEDFRRACEETSGKDLSYFFNEWVYGESYPRYSLTWSTSGAVAAWVVSARIHEVTNTVIPSFFVMPVDLKISGPGWDTTVVVFNTVDEQTFTIPLRRQPHAVVLDPGNWILHETLFPNPDLPATYSLGQNFPNPFNGTTQIPYSTSHRRAVSLQIFDILGRNVATIVQGLTDPGDHVAEWDGRAGNGALVSSGVYFYTLRSEGFVQTREMIVVR